MTAGDGEYGVVAALDQNGHSRARIVGMGSVVIQSATGRQLAGMITTPQGKGRVAVWSAAGKGAEKPVSLDEAPDGSGWLTVSDKQSNPIAVLNADQSGRGVVQVSDKGRTFASLSRNDTGAGQLLLNQPDGSLGLEAVGASQRGGYAAGGVVAAFGADGNPVAGLGTGSNGKGQVTIQDEGRVAASLGVGENATGELSLFNKQGQDSFRASGGDADGQGTMELSNGSGGLNVALGFGESGEGSIMVLHEGLTTAELKSDTTGIGSLELRDASGEVRLAAHAGSAEFPGGAVYAFNKDGKPVVSLGSSADGRGEVTVSEEIREVAKLTTSIVGAGTLYLMNKNGDIGLVSTGQATEGASGGTVTSFAKDSVAAELGTDPEGNGRIQVVAKDKIAAEITVTKQGGGAFWASNSQGKPVAGMGTTEKDTGRLAVYGQNGGGLAQLTESASGAGLIEVKNTKGQIVAGITGGFGDAGAMIVYDPAGKPTAEMSTDSGVGRVVIWNTGPNNSAAIMTQNDTGGAIQVFNSKTNVGNLFVGPGGAGQLQLHDPSGVNMVEAGTGDGIGIVRAGPRMRCAGTKMGLANPDCIVGRVD
jgi:hypothetical protein